MDVRLFSEMGGGGERRKKGKKKKEKEGREIDSLSKRLPTREKVSLYRGLIRPEKQIPETLGVSGNVPSDREETQSLYRIAG